MAGKVVNLRRARKEKARASARAEAASNAARHGETKTEASLRAAREALEARRLEGHRLDDRGPGDADDR